MELNIIDKKKFQERWVACFDILGFGKLVDAAENGTVRKCSITEVVPNGDKILSDLIDADVLRNFSVTELVFSSGFDEKQKEKETVVRKIAGDDFDSVWAALQDEKKRANAMARSCSSVYTAWEKATAAEKFSRQKVRAWHFSDTFVFYSEAKNHPLSLAGNFMRACLQATPHIIPLRGAISFGNFYSDSKRNIYFGSAFNEAYEVAESQDWIGFVLTEKATQRMADFGVTDITKLHFNITEVPLKARFKHPQAFCHLPAYNFRPEISSPIESLLKKELEGISEAAIRRKYENTLKYLQRIKSDYSASEKNSLS